MRGLEKKYSESLKKVKRYKMAATKRDKLWRFFHQFSLNEGYTACKKCDRALELNAHKMFWQLFLEKGFLREVNKALKPSVASGTACASKPREVSDVEEIIRTSHLHTVTHTCDKWCKSFPCSAGVGRTGTFITIDVEMQRFFEKGVVNPQEFVVSMRKNRNHMVQTEVCTLHHDDVIITSLCSICRVSTYSFTMPSWRVWPLGGRTSLLSSYLNEWLS